MQEDSKKDKKVAKRIRPFPVKVLFHVNANLLPPRLHSVTFSFLVSFDCEEPFTFWAYGRKLCGSATLQLKTVTLFFDTEKKKKPKVCMHKGVTNIKVYKTVKWELYGLPWQNQGQQDLGHELHGSHAAYLPNRMKRQNRKWLDTSRNDSLSENNSIFPEKEDKTPSIKEFQNVKRKGKKLPKLSNVNCSFCVNCRYWGIKGCLKSHYNYAV